MAATAPPLLAVLDSIPKCVHDSTIQNVYESGCADLSCVCQSDEVLTKLLYDLLRKCNPTDQEAGFTVAQQLCISIVPSLKEDSRQTEILVIVAVMSVISTLAVILRLIARRISAARYGADDVLVVVALFLTYALNANEIVAVRFGFGKHQLSLPLRHIEKFLLNDWTVQMVFATAISVTRFSLLLFYHRLFPVRRFNIIAIATGCILIGWWLSFCLAVIFSCIPVKNYWDKSIPGHCLDEHALSWGLTGSELIANIIMVVLPIPWLWDLRLVWSKKLALIGLFLLGCFVCVSCIVRFPLLAEVVQTDASYTIVPAGIWIIVECNIGIASVCVPLLRPLLLHHPLTMLRTISPFPRSDSHTTIHTFTDEEQTVSSVDEKPFNPSVSQSNQLYAPLNVPRLPPKGAVNGNRTYRSRIESYSPDVLEADAKKIPQFASRPPSHTMSRHLNVEPDARLRSYSQRRPGRRSNTHSQQCSSQSRSHCHSNSHPHSYLQPHPPSQLTTTPRAQTHSQHQHQHQHHHHHHPRPTCTHQPQTSQPLSPQQSQKSRFSQQQMSEKYRKWYQGRGNEVGHGLWQVEMMNPSALSRNGSRNTGVDRRRDAVVWEHGAGFKRDGGEAESGDAIEVKKQERRKS